MIKQAFIILVFSITLVSCIGMKQSVRNYYMYELYIDYPYISYQGQNSTQSLYLEIDSTNQIWYYGKLIIEKKDTLLIKGFEKGSHYVTTYYNPKTKERERFEIWSSGETGQIRDSLSIEDMCDSNKVVKEITTLYRKSRTICK